MSRDKGRTEDDLPGFSTKKSKRRCKDCDYVDYKDIPTLRRFLSAQGKLYSRKRSGTSAQCQRKIMLAVKRARFMGILSYTN